MLRVICSTEIYKLNNCRTDTCFLLLLLNGNEIWIMKAKDKSKLTVTKMKFIRHTAANNLSSEKLHHHFFSCLYLTWCTVNICSLHSVCFINFSSLSRGHHLDIVTALSTKFTSSEYAHTICTYSMHIQYAHTICTYSMQYNMHIQYAHINILKCDVAIKIFPVSKFGCGEPISPLTSMLQGSYPMHECKLPYILWSTDTPLPQSTIGHDKESLIVTGKLLWYEGSGKLFAHVLNENLSTLVFKNFVLTKIWHRLRKFCKTSASSFMKVTPITLHWCNDPFFTVQIAFSELSSSRCRYFVQLKIPYTFLLRFIVAEESALFLDEPNFVRMGHVSCNYLFPCATVHFLPVCNQVYHAAGWRECYILVWWIINYFTMSCLNFAVSLCGSRNTKHWHRG